MEPVMELLDIHLDFDAFEDYFERFKIWAMTKEDDDVNIVAHFLTFIGKEAYSLLKTPALPEKPISLSYTTLKDLLLDYVKYTNFECGKGGRFRKMINDDVKNSTSFVNICPVASSTLLIHSICNTTIHLAATTIRSCNSDSIKLSIYNDHLSLSTISKDSVESYSSLNLNGIQNSCKTTVSNQYTFQISHFIIPNIVFPNVSHISDEISYKSEENTLSEHNYDQKPDVALMDTDFSDDLLFCSDILNKFEESIQKNQILMS
ncbi:unnamed protein product [Schistosoma curassoni]|uniref:RGS domain-containing protein n=1 Tax=Schistosoma curassoni TaxID=6186 RepID=A0A183K911_9TREM|nr:unnamed protein product [Schistosoma curassoni]